MSGSFGPSRSTGRNYAQYVQAVPDTTAKAFYGTRYVMSNLDQRTLGLDTRASITFSPAMSLQLYAQPFFAAGHYFNYKEYVAPRTTVSAIYGLDLGTVVTTRDVTAAIVSFTIDLHLNGPAQPSMIGNPYFTYDLLSGHLA